MAIAAVGSPIERPSTRVDKPNNGPSSGHGDDVPKQHYARVSVDKEFSDCKKTAGYIASGAAGAFGVVSLLGGLRSGWGFPAKLLEGLGDVCATASTISFPITAIWNEVKNFSLGKNGGKSAIGDVGEVLDLDYRLSSHGLFPFIFERLIKPENITKSVFHKIATVINIPFTLLTASSWGFGNTQALFTWFLRRNERVAADPKNSTNGVREGHLVREKAFDNIYNSALRMAKIGSTANPVMPCIQYAADALHSTVEFFKGGVSVGEFFSNPILNISKALSLGVGGLEAYSKGIDAFMRIFVTEREHLKTVLPNSVYNLIEGVGKKVDAQISDENKDSTLKRIKNNAEMLFHAVSPFAMIGLFAPMLGRSFVSEEARAKGGIAGLADKVLGRWSQALTYVFTGYYVFLGRLPQGIFQSIYFGRKLYGKHVLKEDEQTTQKKLVNLREQIYNNEIVKGVSGFARKCVKACVPNFYDENVKNDFVTLEYHQELAKFGLDQASVKDKVLFDILELYSLTQDNAIRKQYDHIKDSEAFKLAEKENQYGKDVNLEELLNGAFKKDGNTKEQLIELLTRKCLESARKECVQGYYNLDGDHVGKEKIEINVRKKLNREATPKDDRPSDKLEQKIPFGLLLARTFLTTLDLQSFLVNWSHDKLNKLEYYGGKEMGYAFYNEYEVVKAENAFAARRGILKLCGVNAE